MPDQVETKADRSNLAPIPMECDAPHLKIVGELPRTPSGKVQKHVLRERRLAELAGAGA